MELTISELNALSAAMRRELRHFQGIEGGLINTVPNWKYINTVRDNIADFEFKLSLLEKIQREREAIDPEIDSIAIQKFKDLENYRRGL